MPNGVMAWSPLGRGADVAGGVAATAKVWTVVVEGAVIAATSLSFRY
jgi:hypothetical protein